MSKSKRSPRQAKPSSGVTRSKRARIHQGLDGLLDEPDSNSLTSTRMGGAHHEDSRTLAELGDIVMAAASEEAAQASEDSTSESEPQGEAPPESADSPPDEPPEIAQTRSRGRRSWVIVAALLLFAAGPGSLIPALVTAVSGRIRKQPQKPRPCHRRGTSPSRRS